MAADLLFKQIDIQEIVYWDEVLALKTRLLLKALWLLTFLFFSILLSVQLPEPGATILPFLHSNRNADLGAEELDRNYTLIQTKKNGLRDAVVTSPMELLEKVFRPGSNSGRLYAELLAYAPTMRILSFGTRRDSRQNSPNVLSSPRLRRVIERMHAIGTDDNLEGFGDTRISGILCAGAG